MILIQNTSCCNNLYKKNKKIYTQIQKEGEGIMEGKKLTEKENALRAILRNKEPQWVPNAADSMQIVFSSAMQEQGPFGSDGKDWFGCEWIWDDKCNAHAPNVRIVPLLEDITLWKQMVKFPDLDAIDWETAAREDLKDVDRENKLVRQFCCIGPFERISVLMGFENALISPYTEPIAYRELLEALTGFKVKLLHKLLDAYQPDEVFFHDDLGTANGPMISLDMYREFLKPCHKKIADAIHSHGAIYTHHSCGNMEIFIEDLIDNGADMLNPLQPMNDWKRIAETYSDRVSFDVGGEFNANLPDTSEEQLRKDARLVIDTFAPRKNLMFECFISNASCYKNADIMYDEARKYGRHFYTQKW